MPDRTCAACGALPRRGRAQALAAPRCVDPPRPRPNVLEHPHDHHRPHHGRRGALVTPIGKALVTGGGGAIGSNVTDELVLAGADEIDRARQLRPRTAREPRLGARRTATSTLVEGDIRDRALVRELMDGVDVLFHHAAIRITQCAEEPRLALEVLVDGTYNVFEAAVGRRRPQGRRLLVGVGLRARRDVPDHRGPPPVRQRHALRRGEGLQRGPAAQLPRHVRPRLRRAAVLQRLRAADGRPRPLHRGARPLDGADLRGQAAADLRRRPPDDGLRLHGRHRAREHAGRRRRTLPTSSTTSRAGRRPACSSSPRRCCG